jgi:hypothetical protein
MKRFRLTLFAFLAPTLVLALITVGCGKDNKDGGGGGGGGQVSDTTPPGGLKPLEGTGRGTLKGKVTLVGKPDVAKLTSDIQAAMKAHKDKDNCLAGNEDETSQQHWKIGPNNGLGNVFVWLAPPKGYFFKLDASDLDPYKNKTVTMDQPHCAFIPHAVVLFPQYVDPESKKLKPTGEKFVVKNDAKMNHNTKWAGPPKNPGDNKIIPAGKSIDVVLKPSDQEVSIGCDMHTWMNAFARVYDHPFATVTKEDGTYEIKNVPLGVDLQVIAWHEKAGYLKGKEGVKTKLKDGQEENFEAKAP